MPTRPAHHVAPLVDMAAHDQLHASATDQIEQATTAVPRDVASRLVVLLRSQGHQRSVNEQHGRLPTGRGLFQPLPEHCGRGQGRGERLDIDAHEVPAVEPQVPRAAPKASS